MYSVIAHDPPPVSGATVTVETMDASGYATRCYGTGAAPTGAGYAIGCLYRRSDGSAGTTLHVNEGSATSATFVALANTTAAQTFAGAVTVTGVLTASSAATVTGLLTLNGGGSIADNKNIACGVTTGTQIGTSATQKIGLWGATPIVRPVNANLATIALASTNGTIVPVLNAILSAVILPAGLGTAS